MIPPTPQMAETLAAIRRLTRQDVPPKLSDLAAALRVSKGHLHGVLCRMKARGLVDWTPHAQQTLRILGDEPGYESMPTAKLMKIYRDVGAELADRGSI